MSHGVRVLVLFLSLHIHRYINTRSEKMFKEKVQLRNGKSPHGCLWEEMPFNSTEAPAGVHCDLADQTNSGCAGGL